MNEQSVRAEIRKTIADKISNGETVIVAWLITEILAEKSEVSGSDLPFYLACTRRTVAEIVKQCVGKYESAPASNSQVVLPGFEHLQIAYPVERGGNHVLVPIDQLSDAELDQRATEYDNMAKSCRLHAREIRDYVKARREAA
jgi:hypothetical protein